MMWGLAGMMIIGCLLTGGGGVFKVTVYQSCIRNVS